MKYITFGEIMIRLKTIGTERLLQSPKLEATLGGGEANVAVSLANFGLDAAFVTVLPDNNPLASACLFQLRGFGVDTSMIVRSSYGRMGLYFVEGGANQLPSKVLYDRANSSISLAPIDCINWNEVFKNAKWFHLTGITPAISESAMQLSLLSVREAHKNGVLVSCDLNYRNKLWKYGKAAPEVMTELMEFVDVLIANEEDVQNSLGIKTDGLNINNIDLSYKRYQELTELVLQAFPSLSLISITLRESKNANHNSWSACMNNRKRFILSNHYEITNIVDRIGGGDSFSAALIYGLNTFDSDEVALNFAVAASCLKHSISGDFNRVNIQDVLSLMEGNTTGRVKR